MCWIYVTWFKRCSKSDARARPLNARATSNIILTDVIHLHVCVLIYLLRYSWKYISLVQSGQYNEQFNIGKPFQVNTVRFSDKPSEHLTAKKNQMTWPWTSDSTVNACKCKYSQLQVHSPKFNMEPKNHDFQKESPIPGCHFQVNHVTVNFGRVIIVIIHHRINLSNDSHVPNHYSHAVFFPAQQKGAPLRDVMFNKLVLQDGELSRHPLVGCWLSFLYPKMLRESRFKVWTYWLRSLWKHRFVPTY